MGQRTAIVLKTINNIPQEIGFTQTEHICVFYHNWGIGRVLPSQLLSIINGTLSITFVRPKFGSELKPTGCMDITDEYEKKELKNLGFNNPKAVGKIIHDADNNNGGLYIEVTRSCEGNFSIEYNYMLGGNQKGAYNQFCTFKEWCNNNYGKQYIDNNFLKIYHKTLEYFGAKERKIEMTTKEKASACLEELEEYDTKTVINLLNEYLSDEALAEVYDNLKEEKL